MATKILKVSDKYVAAKNPLLTKKTDVFRPMIRFSGKYLRNAGFEIGSHCIITIEQNLIIIKKITDDNI